MWTNCDTNCAILYVHSILHSKRLQRKLATWKSLETVGPNSQQRKGESSKKIGEFEIETVNKRKQLRIQMREREREAQCKQKNHGIVPKEHSSHALLSRPPCRCLGPHCPLPLQGHALSISFIFNRGISSSRCSTFYVLFADCVFLSGISSNRSAASFPKPKPSRATT